MAFKLESIRIGKTLKDLRVLQISKTDRIGNGRELNELIVCLIFLRGQVSAGIKPWIIQMTRIIRLRN